jgi:glycosyltransferase involved in cell wall biosynthesis
MKRVCVVVPVFNDWVSFSILLDHINKVSKTLGLSVHVVAVNDGSTEPEPDWTRQARAWEFLDEIQLVDLAANLGHQKAIAVGLCVAVEDHPWDAVIIMDADGEDPPEQIPTLLQMAEGRTDFSIVAQRRKRSENLTFRFSYLIYRIVFKILTGKRIGFGNFSLISRKSARRLAMIPDLWNNLAAALLRSKLPLDLCPSIAGAVMPAVQR